MTQPDDPFSGIWIGLAVGLVLIVGAVFQDTLFAIVRFLARRGRRAGVSLGRRVASVARASSGGQRAGAAEDAAADEPGRGTSTARPSAEAPVPARVSLRRPTGPATASAPTPPETIGDLPDAAGPSAATTPVPDLEADGDDSPEVEPRSPTPRRSSTSEAIGRRRTYLPVSRVHVAECAREFLEERGGTARADALVRCLDRSFGTGKGGALMESLRASGAISLKRDPEAPMQMVAVLTEYGRDGVRAG